MVVEKKKKNERYYINFFIIILLEEEKVEIKNCERLDANEGRKVYLKIILCLKRL